MPTMTPLQSISVASTTYSVTFSNIDQSYTDLFLVVNGVSGAGGPEVYMQFNNDGAGNYSRTYLLGDGTSAVSGRSTSATNYAASSIYDTNTTIIYNIMNYSNTTTYKNILSTTSAPSAYVVANNGLWRSTSAINSITITFSNIVSSATFDLYGISPVTANNAQAFGGTDIFYDSSYVYHIFKASGVFTPTRNLTADYLVVAGGGGGGFDGGGGGGAGGVRSTVTWTGGRTQGNSLESALSLTANTPYVVTIGAGGGVTPTSAANGNDSVFSSITSTGGGAGRNVAVAGVAGGSGGGGGMRSTAGGAGTTGQGFSGGAGPGSTAAGAAGGGGGASTIGGSAASVTVAGAGGSGLWTAMTNATTFGQLSGGNYYIAGGGGGSCRFASASTPGDGGLGGGGAGGTSGTAGFPGNSNTGSGGGGGAADTGLYMGSSGGSGLVIVRYAR